MKPGDIVLISFPFTDLSGNKNRPALIIGVNSQDIIVVFITSKLKWEEEFDVKISPTSENGLKLVSLFRVSKITTIDTGLVIGKLGELDKNEFTLVKQSLKKLLQL